MINLLQRISLGNGYWVFLLFSGIAFEAVALYYQYALDEWPCVLCIHIRIWIAAIVLISILALLIRGRILLTRVFHIVTTGLAIGFVERSWQVLAVERGWIFGDCDMNLGMPAWFALDKWIPSLFEVQTSCGYTPLIIFEITMAETLIVISAFMLLFSAAIFVASCLE